MTKEVSTGLITISSCPEGFVLTPGTPYLGATIESTSTDKFVPGIEGRSSVGRLGISIHETAGFGDVGFSGTCTEEISFIHPITIYPGIQICQIYFTPVIDSQPEEMRKYGVERKYQGQTGPRPSGLWRDFQWDE